MLYDRLRGEPWVDELKAGGMAMASSHSAPNIPQPEAASHLLEVCRMVLPGIQALSSFLISFSGCLMN
ncbi:MAG: hypothetical protein LZF62_480207 [Nitrospira sp.]|nr:MAG: hypothetical protein LZF62_480207 [Nitrospira sp.]